MPDARCPLPRPAPGATKVVARVSIEVRLRERSGDAERCPYCHGGFGDEEPRPCPSCATRYHADCAQILARCAVIGCRALLAKPSESAWLDTVFESGMDRWTILGAGLGALFSFTFTSIAVGSVAFLLLAPFTVIFGAVLGGLVAHTVRKP